MDVISKESTMTSSVDKKPEERAGDADAGRGKRPLRVFIGPLNTKMIAKSGIGKAITHQKQAISIEGISYLEKANDRYDIFHANTYDFATLYWVKRSKRKGKKVIVHAHSTEEDFRNSFPLTNLVSPFFKAWIKYFYNQGHIIVTPTPYSKGLLESYKLKRPIYDCSNGVDLERFHPVSEEEKIEFKKQLGVPAERKMVISVGLPIKRKGIFDFVALAESMPEYTFVWCGGVNKAILPASVLLLLKKAESIPNIILPGYVTNMSAAYQAADLFFMPSYEETEGIVILEALASKVPILARDIPVYNPWLREREHAYFAKDNEGFRAAITQFFEHGNPEEIREMTKRAYEVARERSMPVIGAKLRRIYEDLLDGKLE